MKEQTRIFVDHIRKRISEIEKEVDEIKERAENNNSETGDLIRLLKASEVLDDYERLLNDIINKNIGGDKQWKGRFTLLILLM